MAYFAHRILLVVFITTLSIISGCASKKQFQTEVSTLTAENKKLQGELQTMKKDMAVLSEEVVLMKGHFQGGGNSNASYSAMNVEEVVFDDDRDPFFEEAIAAAEEETLVITNKDLQNVKWGDSTPKSAAPVKKAPVRSQAQMDYQNAYEKFKEKDYTACRQLMHAFIQKYPNHEHTDNAHFWIGETYFIEKNYPKANEHYSKVITDFPKGNKVPDATLRAGQTSLRMNDTRLARRHFESLIQKHPDTVAATKAKKTLETMQSGRTQ